MAEELTDEQKDFIYQFAKNYETYIPEPKDNMRAEDCYKHPDPVKHATSQLKRIGNVDKFYRRLKAFLQHGIKIVSVKDTYFEDMDSELLRDWMASAVKIYAGNDSPMVKDKKITKLAGILTM